MALGILEDSKVEHVPDNNRPGTDDVRIRPGLKYDKSGPVPVILVPQPSDDPNDPLNWPLWKRDVILTVLSLVSVLCTSTGPIMAAYALTITYYYERNLTAVAILTGYQLCGAGVAGIFIVPTARVWGKRHLYLLGNILMIASTAWAGASGHNYKSLLWSRVIQGVALAPFEALVNASVGDLYFVHERGKRMAFSNVALFGGSFLTPVIAGKIAASMTWQWTFYFVAIFTGVALPLTFFLVPETAFRRPDYLNTDFEGDDERRSSQQLRGDRNDGTNSPSMDYSEPPEYEEKEAKSGSDERHREQTNGAETVIPPRDSYLKTLRPFNGRKTDESFFKLLLRPFPLFLHPGILWACLIQGVLIGWTVFIGVVLAAIFMGPPLWFDSVKTGYLYTGAFIGSIVGLVLSGLLSDSMNRVMIKLNKGKYEPEFRILLVFFQLLFAGTGLYGFGITSSDVGRWGWLIPDVFLMFVIIGMVMGAVASALYIVDAHRRIAVEAFTCLLIFKNMFSFVLTFFAYDWLVESGVRTPFLAIGSIQIAVCLLSIPMCKQPSPL
ncbi:hypothetical protein Plec18170_002720 [Paecilomyces lecythidis]